MALSLTYLFGGNQSWSAANWTSADDTVRGGSSYSYMTILPANTALFHGNLNTTALNGTAFASQETTDGFSWDLSEDAGLELTITGSDGKVYTLTVQDNPQSKQPNGTQQASLIWEYDFQPAAKGVERVKWADLRATYRGQDVPNPTPLNLKAIKRISIMNRSFFGKQEGPFSLGIASIAAFRNATSWTINPHNLQPMKGNPATEPIPTSGTRNDSYTINPHDLQPMKGNPATEPIPTSGTRNDSYTINPHDLQPMKGNPATEPIPTSGTRNDSYTINPHDLKPMGGNPLTEEIPTGLGKREDSYTINPHDLQPMAGNPATEPIPVIPSKSEDSYTINPHDLKPMGGDPATEE